MLYIGLVSAVLLLSGAVLSTDIKEDEGVLVLTSSNFEKAVSGNDFVLVEFYAPWCGHCKALAPEYASAAAKLKSSGSDIKLAKVDATEETDLAEKHNIRGYPTLKFFRNGNVIDYTGGRQADDIVGWLTKKTGPPAKALASVAEVKDFVESSADVGGVVVVGFFSDEGSQEAKHYLEVANAIDGSPFGISSNPDVLKEYSVENAKVVVFKKFGEPNAETTTIESPDQLKNYILLESLPLIVEFNHQTAPKIFGGDIKSHLLIFLSKKDGHFEEHTPFLKELASKFKKELLFVSINVDEPDHKRILEFFGLGSDKFPVMRIIRLAEDMIKYKPESDDVNSESVEKFVQSYIDGSLKEHLLSETLPDDWDKHPVKVLVATNFDEVVFNKEKNVLVEFYAPWCGHCKQLVPIYDKLGEAFADKDDVVIAKIDATGNELEHTKISSFPTIKLYKKGDNAVVDYQGERTLEGLTKFIETGGEVGSGPEYPEEEEEDEHKEDHGKDEL